METSPPGLSTPDARLRPVRLAARLDAGPAVEPARVLDEQRKLLADFCRLLGGDAALSASPAAPSPVPDVPLSPRVQQTLARLLAGDSEKQIACHLKVSPHTVHVYVKTLYRRFGVCSRGELLARFVTPAAPACD